MQVEDEEATRLIPLLSPARLQGYRTPYAQQLHPNFRVLYRWNIQLSQALYPALHIVEVGLRNAIARAIAQHRRNEDWLLTVDFLSPLEQAEVQRQAGYLRRVNKLDTGHLIAELSFGFWCGLLDRRYEHQQLLWPTLLRTVFPYLKNRKIHLIRKRFNQIRRLRNRISHYEPIWHWQDLAQQHQEMLEAIGWIEPALLKLIEVDSFPEVYHLLRKG